MFAGLKPEYFHILVNPYLTHGLPLVVAFLILSIILRNPVGVRLALALSAACSFSAYFVAESGEAGYDRRSAVIDEPSQEWLDLHEERAKSVLPVFYVAGAISLVALVASFRLKKFANVLATAAAVAATGACVAGGYVAYAGGRVSHQELREMGKKSINIDSLSNRTEVKPSSR